MGIILSKYYDYVQQKAGIRGKIELAKLTKVPQVVAAAEPDTAENVRKFAEAVAKVTGAPAPRL